MMEWLDPVMVQASHIGTKSTVWMTICALLFLFGGNKGRRSALLTVGATLTAQGLVNIVLKPIFRRDRPFQKLVPAPALLVDPPGQHSWPSGHAASSAAAMVTLAWAYPAAAPAFLALAAVISYSRIYVGVHYPFDVAAGAGLGLLVGGVWLGLARPLRESHFAPKVGAPKHRFVQLTI
jgi:undecaprenyl-diphosphatase